MHATLTVLIALLAVLVGVVIVARRVGVPAPVLLALAGLGLAAIPGLPRLPLDPDLVLLLFLPPLLYADAFDTSWRDFRRWLRPIMMLATGLVAVTILVVAVVARWCFPELPWAACCALGAIVSPTDTVAAQAVLERLRVGRRLTAVVGGESLVNDATGLVGVQVAVAVLMSGALSLGGVTSTFCWVAGLGLAIGVAVGFAFAWLNRRFVGNDVLFCLSLLSPYLATWIASECGASAVLAVVVAGFIVAWRINVVRPASHLSLFDSWSRLVFVLQGFSFLFIGL